MLHSQSVKARILVSVVSNVLRAVMSFVTGLLIARALSPKGYGDLMFLMGSFVAIRTLLDLGSSSAFFTFLSKRTRGARFYRTYFLWLAFQLFVPLAILWLVVPSGFLDLIWVGHNREIVLLAFVAAFLQQQVWQTVGQIGEAMRKTVQVQLMNLAVALGYLALILLVSIYGALSVEKILHILIGQYVIAIALTFRFLKECIGGSQIEEKSTSEIILDYWHYCRPLVALALVGFAYEFADKWMLQRFGGAVQQGFFQIANQFAVVSLLATSSILGVFWKEIAAAWERQDIARVAMLYRKVSRGLVMLGASITGFLFPWSEEIVKIFLGSAYVHAWPVLAIMLLYPIHQSMGQIGGAMFMARGQTRSYMLISIVVMGLSIPLSYVILAPASGMLIPGLGLGALGMAIKMVILGIVSVNIQALVIARNGGWKFDWGGQVFGIPLMIGLGFIAKLLVGSLWKIKSSGVADLIIPVAATGILYLLMVMVVIWRLPSLIGADRGEIRRLFERVCAGRFGLRL